MACEGQGPLTQAQTAEMGLVLMAEALRYGGEYDADDCVLVRWPADLRSMSDLWLEAKGMREYDIDGHELITWESAKILPRWPRSGMTMIRVDPEWVITIDREAD